MKRVLAVVLLLCLLVGAGPTLRPPFQPPQGWSVRGHVTEILDGDTIEIEVKYRLRVRLLDCWAPEAKLIDPDGPGPLKPDPAQKARGLAAKANLERLADGKEVFLFVPTGDVKTLGETYSLGRVLGACWVDGEVQSLSERQVAAGHASKTEPKKQK